jgi:hypothetical protein
MRRNCFQFTSRSSNQLYLYGGGVLQTTASVILYYFVVFGIAYGDYDCHRGSIRFHPSNGVGGYVDPERISRNGKWVNVFLQRHSYEILQFTTVLQLRKIISFYFFALYFYGTTNSKEVEADTLRQIISCNFVRMGED